jgi:hypothetical protein
MKTLKLILRIFLYWFVAMFTASLIISVFSCFIPAYKYKSFVELGFTTHTLLYFRLTVLFYLFVSFWMAFPGFIINTIIYLQINGKILSKKMKSFVVNVSIGLIICFLYYYLEISKNTDFFYIILPTYLLSIIIWGILILPGKLIQPIEKDKNEMIQFPN